MWPIGGHFRQLNKDATVRIKLILRAIWNKWKVIGQKIGDVQARILLSVFYFAVLGPFAVLFTILPQRLRPRRDGAKRWLKRPTIDGDPLELARRQF